MATKKDDEGQQSYENSSLTILTEKNPEEVSKEALEPLESESESKLEKEHPVDPEEKMETTTPKSTEETAGEDADEPSTIVSPRRDSQSIETEKQPSTSSLSMNIIDAEGTFGKPDNNDSHDSADNNASKNLTGNERASEKTKNELGEKSETGVENESCAQSKPEKSSDDSAEDSEGDDEGDDSDDCQFVESVSPSSKEFKLKQTRVHDWVQSPSQTSYKDKPSFKHNLPHWVDHFDSFFTFIKHGTDSGKNPKPYYVFQCKLCVGVARKKNKICRVRHIGNFLSHLKFHPKQYTKFATENPRLVTKKKPKKSD